MDLANYLSELLVQHGQVSFPGLGNFVRVRVNGYYNDKEARFYPPYHQVKFDPEAVEGDDTFARYVARKKNISLASSKYFAEKYTSKLREQAAINTIAFADLGWFSADATNLYFKPNDKITADPSFYGYEPLNIFKLSQPAAAAPASIKTIYAEPEASPVVSTPPPYQPSYQQPYDDEEVQPRRRMSIWMILLIIIVAGALGLFGIYKFAPDLFDKLSSKYHEVVDKKAEVVVPETKPVVRTDTVKKTVVQDTTAAKVAAAKPAQDTTAVAAVITGKRFELQGSAFRTKKWADNAILQYKAKGIDAHIIDDGPGKGKLFHISLGTYRDEAEAIEAKQKLIGSGKVKKNGVVIIPYN